MWRTLVFIGALAGSSAHAQEGGSKKEPPSASSLAEARAEAQTKEKNRVQALSRRGLLSNYQQLLGAGKVPATTKGRSIQLNTQQAEAASRVTAIDLAALGFTASDVTNYRGHKTDLFDVAFRLFRGRTSPIEQMMLADTVVIATAGKVEDNRTRVDGFLSATPYAVVKSLKGSRAPGDIVYIPSKSGPQPGGLYLSVSSDIQVTPGRKYLLVASKNWYEQRVAEDNKQAQSSFNVAPYLVYEISDNGALLPRPQPTIFGETPKDIQSVENDLRNLAVKNGNSGRRHEN